MIKTLYRKIIKVFGIFFNYPISAFAAQTAFFLIISAFPLAMLLITLIGYIPGLEEQMLQSELSRIMPELFNEFADKIFEEIYEGRTVTLISVTAVSALWAASKGFVSLIRGMNLVNGIQEQRNFFVVRGMAMLCTFGLMLAIIGSLILMVFGQKIAEILIYYFPALERAAFFIISFRALVLFVLLTGLFLVLYLAVPNRRSTLRGELPGAVFSALGWIIFSMLYSLYLSNVNSYIYGSLTSAVFIMLWLYACIYILFIGAELNCYIRLKNKPSMIRKGE
ncbi:MAG: YihY/virulence factor BrkB family protein [Clostridia bacterium]|nr:YihY/virulence factor BrkB family protein [Clostridia bacterium]